MATIPDITNSLKKLGEEVKKAKLSMAELEGRAKEITERMVQDFQVKDLEAARVLLAKEEGELRILEEKIQKEFDTLVKNYEW
jgi:DNA integrity scanning protein DisA with diadenylate cyclase activity